MDQPIYTIDSVGCFIDAHRGRFIGVSVIDLAMSYGFELDIEGLPDLLTSEWENTLVNHEHYYEVWDLAEYFLNDLTSDDVYFGSNESGDWGLWEVETLVTLSLDP